MPLSVCNLPNCPTEIMTNVALSQTGKVDPVEVQCMYVGFATETVKDVNP